MLPTKLGIEIAARTRLYDVTEDKEAAHNLVHHGIADVQKLAMAGASVEECVEIFKVWQMSPKQTRSKKSANELIKLTPTQQRGLELIHRMILTETNGHIIGCLAGISEVAADKEKLEAIKVMHNIMNGEDVADNATKVAELIVGLASSE